MDFAKYGFPIKTCYTPSIGGGVNLSGSALIETVSVAHWDFETALGETIRKKYESQYVRVVEIKNVVNRKPWPVVNTICNSDSSWKPTERCSSCEQPEVLKTISEEAGLAMQNAGLTAKKKPTKPTNS